MIYFRNRGVFILLFSFRLVQFSAVFERNR